MEIFCKDVNQVWKGFRISEGFWKALKCLKGLERVFFWKNVGMLEKNFGKMLKGV